MSFAAPQPSMPLGEIRPPPAFDRDFLVHHAGWPLAVFALATVILIPLRGDLWLADRLYAWEGHRWSLQQGFVTQHLIHVMGKRLSTLGWYGVALLLIASGSFPRLKAWRRPLFFLLLATALSTAAVGTLKLWTDMDCPWDLARYGGSRPFVDLFSARPARLPTASCFPAGHASAGYAWVALYFFFLATAPRLRWLGLGVGLAAGLLFGFAQQLRGAHFLSHDLWTLAICWTIALLLHACLLVPARSPAARRVMPAPPAPGLLSRSEP
ncbi:MULTISPECIES: phosphatase PAP2 family protein [unclassified Pseudoxanthomonas]|jgi:membrane-associated PAP2 superfamily phosphatase|uniref:phosphatase PAP2 family protein n=1 Tax=unclassified Pseudoxanthomonas TaxID=2645906 RepID=UPI0017A6A8FD|nr:MULTISPECIES: phosphatase PAP2 family protein [unclassified Pseudoxanthomonas]MBB3276125.1 membrane-associated PAP2 superfamily phosphatase [Pseudoxanthomonas sp. OG2]UBB25000.1 phosphatase PAP2 family protein [Pseudoxanthomonas japonensis]